MFAYCDNNPINFTDSAGTRREYVRVFCGGIDSTIVEPIRPNEPETTDVLVETVRQELLAKGYSIYKGVLVIKVDALEYGGFSLNIEGVKFWMETLISSSMTLW